MTHPNDTSEIEREAITPEEAEVLQSFVQAFGPIPEDKLPAVLERIRAYLERTRS